MRCKICGTENKDGMLFCTGCGALLSENKKPDDTWQLEKEKTPISAKKVTKITKEPESVSEEYKPISMWGYFGYEILFAIPLVGFILLLVFSFGGTQNKNLKNFARSYFCFGIVMIVVIILLLGYTGLLAAR